MFAEAPTGSIVLAGVPVWVPASYRATRPAGVLVMLHGAGGKPAQSLALLEGAAEQHGFLVVAPKSADVSWDVLHGGYGFDFAQIDDALEAVFDAYVSPPPRMGTISTRIAGDQGTAARSGCQLALPSHRTSELAAIIDGHGHRVSYMIYVTKTIKFKRLQRWPGRRRSQHSQPLTAHVTERGRLPSSSEVKVIHRLFHVEPLRGCEARNGEGRASGHRMVGRTTGGAGSRSGPRLVAAG